MFQSLTPFLPMILTSLASFIIVVYRRLLVGILLMALLSFYIINHWVPLMHLPGSVASPVDMFIWIHDMFGDWWNFMVTNHTA